MDAGLSKLKLREITLYRTKAANTFCQGPVAPERARPTFENDKFAIGGTALVASTREGTNELAWEGEGREDTSAGPGRRCIGRS